MANHERGELGVEVGGRHYTLRPTLDSLCELESRMHQNIPSILASIEQGLLSGVRTVVWALLQEKHGHEIRELKDASAWIEKAGGVDVVLSWLRQVMGENSDPVAEGDPANPPIGQTDGTGTSWLSVPAASV